MITLSVDPHPVSHTVVALNPNGAISASIRVPNTADGLCQLQVCSSIASRRWAIEGAGHRFMAVFVGQLLERSEMVYSMPPSLSGQYRSRRGRKKNDVVDAENVGRALLANPQLMPLHNPEQQRELQELTRAQRRLSEPVSANRVALQELLAESAVRDIIEQVIAVLLKQLDGPAPAPSSLE
jgi:transposase